MITRWVCKYMDVVFLGGNDADVVVVLYDCIVSTREFSSISPTPCVWRSRDKDTLSYAFPSHTEMRVFSVWGTHTQ